MLTSEKIIKIECIKKDIKIDTLAAELGMSRQLMWHHVKKNNIKVLQKIQKYLDLPNNIFKIK